MNQKNHQHALVAATMTSYLRRQPDNHNDLSMLYISNPARLRTWPETVTKAYIKNPGFPLGVSYIQKPNSSSVSHAAIRFYDLLLSVITYMGILKMGKGRERSESKRACLDLAGNSKCCSIASVPRKEGGLRIFCLVKAGSRSGAVGGWIDGPDK